MSADVAQRAFEPFFTTKPKGQGTGLGLATVYGRVTHAGGCVALDSAPGAGTTVTILLPADEDETPPTGTDPTPADGADTAAGPHRTILLVDDEDGIRESLARVLARHGHRLLTAADGRQALDLVRRHPDIDLLLTDIVMPHMHGVELAQRVTDLIPAVQVIYMSGHAEPLVAGAHDIDDAVHVLRRPFTTADLLQALRSSPRP